MEKSLSFLFPALYFQLSSNRELDFSKCFPLKGMVVLCWWCWLFCNGIWFLSNRNMCGSSDSLGSFPALGFPSPEEITLKGDLFPVIFISQMIMH